MKLSEFIDSIGRFISLRKEETRLAEDIEVWQPRFARGITCGNCKYFTCNDAMGNTYEKDWHSYVFPAKTSCEEFEPIEID